MKHSVSTLTAALLLAGATPVLAASSVDLTVKGLITPAACTPVLSAGGVVDHGKISTKDLHPIGNTVLPPASLQLAVDCEAPTLVAVKSADNRAGTSAEWGVAISSFGLGLTSGNVKIGWYTLKMTNATADDVPQPLIESVDGQLWFDAPQDTVWQPNWMRTFNGASNAAPTPLPLARFKTDVVIATTLRGQRELPLTEETLIDGSATLDIVYL